MVHSYEVNQPCLVLSTDFAAEFPVYLYLSKDEKTLLYSKSIVNLLNDGRVKKPLEVNYNALSFILQSNVVPPPLTIYKNIFIVGLGDTVSITTKNSRINLDFSHKFPFLNKNRTSSEGMQPDEDFILKILAESVDERVDHSKPSFLFHSAGKDSNSIALALAEAGWQDRFTLITHQLNGEADESEISACIARKLGFKHQIVHGAGRLNDDDKNLVIRYFSDAPFPCTDKAAMPYSLYATQIPLLKNANIIDGGGNDSYMSIPPARRELSIMQVARFTHHLSFLRPFVNSESRWVPLLKTPAERCGMGGFSYSDTRKIIKDSVNVYSHWKKESRAIKELDLFDFKTSILTSVVASELHIRKVRNFSDAISANLILPFSNERVAKYFYGMPESYLFDRKLLKNKLILRQMLLKRMGLDSDRIGKKGFSYDSEEFVSKNLNWVYSEIISCPLWINEGVRSVINRFSDEIFLNNKKSKIISDLIYKIFLISSWHNNCKYIN